MSDIHTKEDVDLKIHRKRVVIFSKTTCGFCNMAKEAMAEYKEQLGDMYEEVEIDLLRPDLAGEVQDYLKQKTGDRRVPRVFIDGECIGGGTDTVSMQNSGQLKSRLGF